MFKRVISETGQELWYKDGKLTAKKYIPQEDIDRYEKPIEKPTIVFTKTEVPENKPKTYSGCIFCGGAVESQRSCMIGEDVINVKLCGGCYYEKTLGEVVQKVNKEKLNGRI
jgi:hypothetical protein